MVVCLSGHLTTNQRVDCVKRAGESMLHAGRLKLKVELKKNKKSFYKSKPMNWLKAWKQARTTCKCTEYRFAFSVSSCFPGQHLVFFCMLEIIITYNILMFWISQTCRHHYSCLIFQKHLPAVIPPLPLRSLKLYDCSNSWIVIFANNFRDI